MLRKDWYLEAMEDANIPLTRTEKEALAEENEIRVGRFDERRYIRKLERQAVPITKNQKKLMQMIACVDQIVLQIRSRNKEAK